MFSWLYLLPLLCGLVKNELSVPEQLESHKLLPDWFLSLIQNLFTYGLVIVPGALAIKHIKKTNYIEKISMQYALTFNNFTLVCTNVWLIFLIVTLLIIKQLALINLFPEFLIFRRFSEPSFLCDIMNTLLGLFE